MSEYKVLGIFHSTSDPSAAIMVGQELKAYAEEERFIRNKHARGTFPIKSIDYVLKREQINIEELDCIVQAWNCKKYDDGTIAEHYKQINERYPANEEDIAYQQNQLKQFRSETQKEIILRNLKKHYGNVKVPEIRFVDHHLAHACTAYFNSGMKESLVLTIDGSGEEITTQWWLGKDKKLSILKTIKIPYSLGWFYSAFTEYLGFRAYNGEYKVMGLAAYGRLNDNLRKKIDKIVTYDGKGGFKVDPSTLVRGTHSYSYYFSDNLVDFMGEKPRSQLEPIRDWHKDCAYAVQAILEKVVLDMARYWSQKTGVRKLCISGGVGLNVKMNGKLLASHFIDDIFIYPICADAGSSIGAAMTFFYELIGLTNKEIQDVYLGPEYSREEIKEILVNCKIAFTEEKNIERRTAELISNGKIVAWFQGRMEGGQRALGARSIIADPRDPKTKDKVNEIIKYREHWRPFCPSMTIDGAKRYLIDFKTAPFMIVTFKTNNIAIKEVPSVVHVDNTSRPQVVTENNNPRFYRLIREFQKITNTPVVLNTSFNIKGEPIVCTPQDALRTFYSTGLDALALGDFMVTKT